MKKTLLLIVTSLFLISCEKQQREIIVAKWDNGTPKKINYVVGEGVKQEIVGRITYYENGEIEIKGEYAKGKKQGKHEYYDENGQVIKEETYKGGKLDGKVTGWFENGQKRIEGSYKDGERTDIWKSWDSLGVFHSFSDWFSKGYLALTNKEYDKALSFYLIAIELDPDAADAYTNLGIAYKNQGNLTKAIESYERAIELYPDDATYYYNLANTYDDQGNPTKAIQLYEKAIELDPEYDKAYHNLAIVYKNQGNLTKAIQLYEKAIELDPDNADAYSNLGVAYKAQGNLTKAIQLYEKAIELDPEFAKAYHNLGNAYHDSNFDKALIYYKKAARWGNKSTQDWLKKNGYDW